ncbi:MAG: hypothetical protein GXP27_16820, partial [Planctomycetes bacterium]|nr:hypothetical protein [Planctomycetota bacterium]
ADGNRLFMYWEGYQWCFRAEETGYDGTARFEKEGAPLAVRRRNGEVLVLEHGGRTFTNMCRWLSEARDIVAESCLRCVDYGADAVQIEVVGGESHSCYARSHGHPVPTGPWQFQCLRGTFERVRSEGRKRNPDFVLTMEEPNELCIPFLDGYHARDYKVVTWPVRGIGAEGCPLFAYVYHQYHLGFAGWGDFSACRQYGTGQLLAYARSLVYGKMLADRWARLAPEDKPELDFLRDAANLLANAREYLLFGEMLRPMKVDTGELEVVLNVRNPRTRKVTQYLWRTPKVLHAAYRAADGSIGCVYVNIAQKPLAFSTEIHDAKLGARRCTILRGPPGSSQVVADGITLPHQINLKLAPRQILFLQVRPD